MCGRFNYGSDMRHIQGWSDLIEEWPDAATSYNVAPSTQIAAFRSNQGEMMRWGMIAPWSKSFDSKYATFNARIETIAEKPTFRSASKHKQRCLIPMSGYYEWKGEKGNKQPFYITDRDTGGLFVAGLYESWGDNDQLSCTMLTKPANNELAHIHPRTPLMLTPDSAHNWMRGDTSAENLQAPSVIFYPVSRAVGNVKNDDESLLEPIDL